MTLEFDSEVIIKNLEKRISFYKLNMVTLDDLFGYMQALRDLGLLENEDIRYIISDLID